MISWKQIEDSLDRMVAEPRLVEVLENSPMTEKVKDSVLGVVHQFPLPPNVKILEAFLLGVGIGHDLHSRTAQEVQWLEELYRKE